jgi:hypothetical protein
MPDGEELELTSAGLFPPIRKAIPYPAILLFKR